MTAGDITGLLSGRSSLTIEERLDILFTYHAPTPDDQRKYTLIRGAGRALAQVILEECTGADASAALRKVREAVAAANAAIACKGAGRALAQVILEECTGADASAALRKVREAVAAANAAIACKGVT